MTNSTNNYKIRAILFEDGTHFVPPQGLDIVQLAKLVQFLQEGDEKKAVKYLKGTDPRL